MRTNTAAPDPVLVNHVGIREEDAIAEELAEQALVNLPIPVRNLMWTHGVWVAGGFLRSILQGEDPNDIDIFGPPKGNIQDALRDFLGYHPRAAVVFSSENAVTVMLDGDKLQFVLRDAKPSLAETIDSFDFTICRAGIGLSLTRELFWDIRPEFLHHTADRFLWYTNPDRSQTPAAPYRRMLSFIARGYRPCFVTMASVLGPLAREAEALQDQALSAEGMCMSWQELFYRVLDDSRVQGTY